MHILICYEVSMFCFNGLTHMDYLYMRRKFDFPDENDLVKSCSRNNSLNLLSILTDCILHPSTLLQIFCQHFQYARHSSTCCQNFKILWHVYNHHLICSLHPQGPHILLRCEQERLVCNSFYCSI